MKFSKRNLVASVVSLIMVSSVMAEESAKSWDKIVMAGIGIPLARHKVEIGGEKKNINSQGGGLFTEYVTIEKETNLSLVLNGTVGGYLSDDFPSGTEFGGFFSTFAGLGYAPVNNEKIKFVAAAGIGADCFGYEMEHNGIRNIVDAVEFSAGIDLALIANLSDRIGIGFNVLGMAGIFGAGNNEVKDMDTDIKEDNKFAVKPGSIYVMPSIGVTVHF